MEIEKSKKGDKPIHVMHVLNSLGYGGAEAGVVKMIRGFSAAGLRHSVVTMSQDLSLKSSLPEGTFCQALPIKNRDRKAFLKLRSLFIREQVDLAHVNNLGPWFDVALGARLAGCKSVETFHGVENPEMRLSLPKRFQALLTAGLTHSITAVSEPAGVLFSNLTGISLNKISIIPNGIDTRIYAPVDDVARKRLKSDLSLPVDCRLVGCVAALREVKNHKGLIHAFRNVIQNDRNVCLVLVGDGPLKKELEDTVRDLGMERHVLFTGKTDDVPKILKCLDLFVLNSRTEGLSYAVLEAMATGLPVIVTRVGGNPVLVEDKITGRLVRPGNINLLSDAIVDLLDRKEIREGLGEQARAKILSEYSMDKMLSRYLTLYQNL